MLTFVVVDLFGFAWGDILESREEAEQQLKDIQADCESRGWDIEFEIEVRRS